MTDSQVVAREPCPSCGSRDNLARYDDGHAYCFGMGCEYFEPGDGATTNTRKRMSHGLLPFGDAGPIPKRGLSEETCRKWGYTIGSDRSGNTVQIANFRDDAGNIVGQQTRDKDKNFRIYGDISELLYGRWLWRSTGKRVWITEGQIDALTVSQVLDNRWTVVSIPHGTKSARKAIAANIEWLNKFDQVSLCFDMDEPGKAAVASVTDLFPPGKLSIVSLPEGFKDPNEMLMDGKVAELIDALWGAKPYRPDGIKTVSDIRDEALADIEEGLPWFLPEMNELTYGRRYGECVAVGAGTGVGKTTLITQQVAFDLELGHDVGVFFLEQSPGETVRRVAGQQAKKTFHAPDGSWSQAELTAAIDKLADSPAQLYLYDHFGACDWNVIRERIRFLRHSKGVRLFYLDHLTALAAYEEDERRGLERIMAELGSLVKELGIWLLFVSHLTTPDGDPHEEGGRVTLRHFKGSRAIGYWAHFAFGLERNKSAERKSERMRTVVRCLKDRNTGRADGETWPIAYDEKTGVLFYSKPEKRKDHGFQDETNRTEEDEF